MGIIALSKNEKQVLRMISVGQGACPASYPLHSFNACVRSLENKGLVRGAYHEGGIVADSKLTDIGVIYLAENPRLTNPVDWGKVGVLVGAVSAIVAVVALFIACSRII